MSGALRPPSDLTVLPFHITLFFPHLNFSIPLSIPPSDQIAQNSSWAQPYRLSNSIQIQPFGLSANSNYISNRPPRPLDRSYYAANSIPTAKRLQFCDCATNGPAQGELWKQIRVLVVRTINLYGQVRDPGLELACLLFVVHRLTTFAQRIRNLCGDRIPHA